MGTFYPSQRATSGARKAAESIPHGKIVLLPGVSHVPHLEVPDRFHTELLRFLAQRRSEVTA
jgi:pimeloyl-ACP methyl ester carboxylesterase